MTRNSRFRSTAALAIALLAALELAARADAAAPARKATAPTAPRVIVVGWDGGDWTLLDSLVASGRMPNLAALLARGRSWNLDSYQPMASPLIWTTIATGRTPVDHGVADFQELDPKTKVRLPISGRSRRVPAIWNLATAKGVSVGIVGWWATWPAEKVDGFFVSDRAAPVLFDPETLSRSPALTWPEGLADGVRIVGKREGTPGYEDVAKGLKITRSEFDAAVAAKKDLRDPITGYQKVLGSMRVYARTALELYDRNRPQLLMVYFQGTDEIGHVLAKYHPPKLANVPEAEFAKFSGGADAFYAEADRVLGEFLKRAERDGATLLLASDHGFRWGKDRPGYYSSIDFDTAFLWHRSPGILAAMGPGVTPSKERGKASVFDVAPTLCRLLGLPPDPAFEGKPVAGLATKGLPRPAPAVSWAKAAPVERLVPATDAGSERKAAEEFTKKLISLGYLTGAEAAAVDARPADRAGTETAGSFQNIATFLRARGRVKDSLPFYEKALEVNPRSATAWMNLSIALQTLSRFDDSDDALLKAVQFGYHDPEATVYRRVATYMERSKTEVPARAQLVAFLRRVTAAYPDNVRYAGSLGKVLFERQDCAGAEEVFRSLVARQPNDLESLNLLALSSWCLGKTGEARSLLQRSLALDPNQPIVREGLAQIDRGGQPPR